jgi:hypothetical protein
VLPFKHSKILKSLTICQPNPERTVVLERNQDKGFSAAHVCLSYAKAEQLRQSDSRMSVIKAVEAQGTWKTGDTIYSAEQFTGDDYEFAGLMSDDKAAKEAAGDRGYARTMIIE